jgi:hypothetical protein
MRIYGTAVNLSRLSLKPSAYHATVAAAMNNSPAKAGRFMNLLFGILNISVCCYPLMTRTIVVYTKRMAHGFSEGIQTGSFQVPEESSTLA